MLEMSVCAGLMGLCMLCVAQIVSAGARYYNAATKTTDLQQSCLLTATELINELAESSLVSVHVPSPAGAGLVFCSPRGIDGEVRFQGTSMIWKKWVAYYTVDEGLQGWQLRREEELLDSATPVVTPPFVPANRYLPHFRASPDRGRLVARYIYDLSVERTDLLALTIGAQDEVGEFRVMVQTKVKTRN